MTNFKNFESELADKMQTNTILHILRNPYGWSRDEVKRAQLQACNEIEEWRQAYRDLLGWCGDQGLDTVAYNRR